jgi:hypothetical protein
MYASDLSEAQWAFLQFKAKEAASEEETSLPLDFLRLGKTFDGMLLSRQELQSREEPGWTVQE